MRRFFKGNIIAFLLVAFSLSSCSYQDKEYTTVKDKFEVIDAKLEYKFRTRRLFVKPSTVVSLKGSVNGVAKINFDCKHPKRCLNQEIILSGQIDTLVGLSNFYDKTLLVEYTPVDVEEGQFEGSIDF
ncbi:hypothetical protein [Jiulongibacter sp. NS-SX5]|uniref:hypothetical protein n=1 Tax=Jiulongibacter sp. NS-SX5 TaxID=3463854 RepID=UPI004058B768